LDLLQSVKDSLEGEVGFLFQRCHLLLGCDEFIVHRLRELINRILHLLHWVCLSCCFIVGDHEEDIIALISRVYICAEEEELIVDDHFDYFSVDVCHLCCLDCAKSVSYDRHKEIEHDDCNDQSQKNKEDVKTTIISISLNISD
jgi:hypothetical protein